VTISRASARRIVKVVEIWDLRGGGGGRSRSLINLAIEFAGTTSADEAGKKEKEGDEADHANDREHSSDSAFLVKETEKR